MKKVNGGDQVADGLEGQSGRVEDMATSRRVEGKAAASPSELSPSAIVPWAAILALVALVLDGLAVGAGSLLEWLYPLATFAVGVLLYWRYPTWYLGFAWWLWFLTPEVRRLVDYQEGWTSQSPVMLAPYLVAALACFTLLRHLPKLESSRFLPFGLAFLGIFYGYVIGTLKVGPFAATFDLLNWLVPVVFAFHLVVHWRSYPRYRRVIQLTFVWGVLIMGLYGLLQFFSLPVWDRYWMLNAPITSMGRPEPFELRVFSTLNSPGSFAIVMMAGLLLLLTGGGLLRWPAAGVGYASFLLSSVRAAWGGWMVALPFIVAQRSRYRLRLLAVLAVMGLLILPLLTVGPIADRLGTRLQDTVNLWQDESFRDRLEFYSEFLPQALLSPVGEGMGSTGVATQLGTVGGNLGQFGNFDSGIMNIPFVLGWPGSLLYVGGMVWLLLYALRSGGSPPDLFAAASRGIAVAVLAQLVFVNTLTGVSGMIFWSFLGLALMAHMYWSSTKDGEQQGSIKRLI